MSDNFLLEKARDARKNAYAPLTNYSVGAALLTKTGKIYTGCNIEDISGIGEANSCAERTAIIKAMSEGEREFTTIAVVGGKVNEKEILTSPCGICRQYMLNYNPEMRVVFSDGKTIISKTLNDLLPYSFEETFEN